MSTSFDDVRLQDGQLERLEAPVAMRVARIDEHLLAPLPTARLGRLQCHAVTMSEALARIESLVGDHRTPHLVVTPNIAHVYQASRSHALREAYRRASLSMPDGWPVVLAVRLLTGRTEITRVTGADLVPELLSRELRVMVVGGGPGSAQRLAARVAQSGSRCEVHVEPLTHEEFADDGLRQAVLHRIAAVMPDVVLVGIGTPKQEQFALELMDVLPHGVIIPVGAAIDYASGAQSRCPTWLRERGGEWLYRLVRDPRRLWKRYAVSAPYFLSVVAVEVGKKAFDPRR